MLHYSSNASRRSNRLDSGRLGRISGDFFGSDDWKEMKLILPGINDEVVREKEETLGEL